MQRLFGGQTIQLFFPQLAKKIQSQGSSYDSVIIDSLQRIQVWFANFNLRYPWSSKSRGVSSSKERTGLSYGQNQLCFWSISLLFISAQGLALGNYTEWKRTSISTDTSPTKRTHFDSCVCVHACIGPFSQWNKYCDAFVCACVAKENQAQQKVMILATGSLTSITFQGF